MGQSLLARLLYKARSFQRKRDRKLCKSPIRKRALPFQILRTRTFLRDNRPEIVLSLGKVITLTESKQDRKELTHYLERALEETCSEQEDKISHGDLSGFKFLFKQQLKWYRQIEQRLKRVEAKK